MLPTVNRKNDSPLARATYMTEPELFAAIKKHLLTVTPSGSYKDRWVAYNNLHTGRGVTPEEAVREVARRLEGATRRSS